MRFSPSVVTRAALVVMVVSFALPGCTSDKSTNPTGGGSNGGSLFDSGTLTAPATFDHAFATAGTFGYFCRFHRSMGMTGTVTVVAGGADAADVNASGTSFTPSTVSIKPGGVVHWHVTGGQHTVTSN